MPMRAILGRLMSLNGSVLVFAIIILAVILVTSLSVVSISILDRTSSFSTAQSVQSFTVAQSGVEMVLAAVKKQAYNDSLSTVLTDLSGWTCTGGVLAGPVLDGNALVSFRTADGETTITSCDTEIFNLGIVKVVGDYNGTARGIETAVAQTTTPGEAKAWFSWSGATLDDQYNVSTVATGATGVDVTFTNTLLAPYAVMCSGSVGTEGNELAVFSYSKTDAGFTAVAPGIINSLDCVVFDN